jgi:two-component system sensor histidine kinase BaeS
MSGRRFGLQGRLFAAQALTAVVSAITVWLVASVVGPGLFHRHMMQVSELVNTGASHHVELAFTSANAISISIALVASLTTALAVSAYASRRIAAPVRELALAAERVTAGHFGTKVPSPGIGGEFETLTSSFNDMAAQLQAVEGTRRRLLGDIGHELRTPVATVDGYLEGMQDGVIEPDGETISMLRIQMSRLARLADDIGAVSRAEEARIHLQPLAPDDLVRTAVAAASDRFLAAGVMLNIDIETKLPTVSGDSERLGQVLGNLLDNALRHTETGGQVSVNVAQGVVAGTVEIDVADTGDGIQAEHLPHVFERFYRVDRARDRDHGGSGIGLAIVKALVEAHGGSVTAASEGVECGSTFMIILPAERPLAG